MKPNDNNKMANMNYNELLPAKNMTASLREVITPRKSYVWERNNTPANKKVIGDHLEEPIHQKQ